MTLMYDGFIKKIATAFEGALAEIDAGFNFDYGPEFEIVMCKTLRRILPQKFGVCRGYLVNQKGTTKGDDIIIYEKIPTSIHSVLVCELQSAAVGRGESESRL
jgi:hypothetical protein